MKKKLTALLLCLSVLLLSACRQTDVVANYAIRSMETITTTLSSSIQAEGGGYTLKSPAATESFHFGDSLRLIFELAPFEAAGLDVTKLPSGISVSDGKLIIETSSVGAAGQTVEAAIESMVRNNRDALGYHTDHDVFEFILGDGHALRWARDLEESARDLVFVLDPAPFVAAGLDPKLLEGWQLSDVEVMVRGKMFIAPRLLRRFDIV